MLNHSFIEKASWEAMTIEKVTHKTVNMKERNNRYLEI